MKLDLTSVYCDIVMKKFMIRETDLVVLMTGYSPDVTGKSPEELGIALVIDKPINISDFSAQIRNVLSGRLEPLSR